MKTIELTDLAARISSITETNGIFTVNLEWGGPSDRSITDFELSLLSGHLGSITASGGNTRNGWVTLDGDPGMSEGDTLPLEPRRITLAEAANLPPETEITLEGRSPLHGGDNPSETRTLADWLAHAEDKANWANHEPKKTPLGLLQYLVADIREPEFYARA
jgi:hypothetical protein